LPANIECVYFLVMELLPREILGEIVRWLAPFHLLAFRMTSKEIMGKIDGALMPRTFKQIMLDGFCELCQLVIPGVVDGVCGLCKHEMVGQMLDGRCTRCLCFDDVKREICPHGWQQAICKGEFPEIYGEEFRPCSFSCGICLKFPSYKLKIHRKLKEKVCNDCTDGDAIEVSDCLCWYAELLPPLQS
jgi:hypothetical protein